MSQARESSDGVVARLQTRSFPNTFRGLPAVCDTAIRKYRHPAPPIPDEVISDFLYLDIRKDVGKTARNLCLMAEEVGAEQISTSVTIPRGFMTMVSTMVIPTMNVVSTLKIVFTVTVGLTMPVVLSMTMVPP